MGRGKGMNGHFSTTSKSVEWYTDPVLLASLGEFDLDPASPIVRPWDTAKHHYNRIDDGLKQPWFGRVWLNPPYGSNKQMSPWMERMIVHGNGTCLLFARTETKLWFDYIWPHHDSIFWLKGRWHFFNEQGVRAKDDCGGPLALIAYGEQNVEYLEDCGLPGVHKLNRSMPVMVVMVNPTWKNALTVVMERVKDGQDLPVIYEMVEQRFPDKVRRNPNYKAKVRQMMQLYFKRISKGKYAHEERTISF